MTSKIRVKVLSNFTGIDDGQTHAFIAGTEAEIAGDRIDDYERAGFLKRIGGEKAAEKAQPVRDAVKSAPAQTTPKAEEHPGGPRDEIISTEIETATLPPQEKATGRGAKR